MGHFAFVANSLRIHKRNLYGECAPHNRVHWMMCGLFGLLIVLGYFMESLNSRILYSKLGIVYFLNQQHFLYIIRGLEKSLTVLFYYTIRSFVLLI